jgi:hypothetical protein
MSDAPAKRVEKEELKDVVPAKEKKSLSPAERQHRLDKLKTAMVLGNSYKSKCNIVFEDINGLKNVETTIWMANDMHIVLKGGIILPISCIRDVII